ncbi:hypothetical protein ES703_88063 [subsurface metagenome]
MGRGGRYGVEDPRKNHITFKVSDHELLLLDMLSDPYESRSAMIRSILFDFALELDPEKVKANWDEVKFDGVRRKVEGKIFKEAPPSH